MRKLKTAVSMLIMSLGLCLTGCGGNVASISDNQTFLDNQETGEVSVPDGDYIELALNVYYNDSESGYYSNESGSSIYVTGEGQYSLSFDCSKDLSDEAIGKGVNSLTNLTAIYIRDMGASNGNQSALSSCDIMYDSVVVDGTELTITLTQAKSAFKSSGVFDTNDPINAWDGSYVEEVVASDDHVANFTTVDNPTTITVTFTLSNMSWGSTQDSNEALSGSGYVNESVFSDMDLTNVTARELTVLMGNGINLGNTMEAFGRPVGTNAAVSTYETYWGQPVTTSEMIQGMKNCGFDSIRIPVAWTNMMNYESGDYTINEAYLDRVQEIVDYALDAEMFVIINDHWDGGWWAMFGSSDETSAANAFTMYETMWTQIAERFADYPDMLIFESANEELGDGLNDNSDWPDSGLLTESDCYELTNIINQDFVDTIRSTGGNNDDRFLLIAGYNTDFDKTVDDRFHMPQDTASDKLILSVHYYSPWNYCGAERDSRWGLVSEYEYMNDQFDKLTKFTDAGYGVIIGEYGALPVYDSATRTSTMKSDTYIFTENLLDNCDKYNYCPMLWSCNDFFNKKTLTMIDDSITELFISRCYQEEMAAGDGYLDTVLARMEDSKNNALEMWEGVTTYEPGTPVAWIMWNGGAGTYSVGDVYNPADNTSGITAHDVVVDGAGTYTVSLDFAGGNTGLTFAALAIADGETLYPGCIIDIKQILIDGTSLPLIAPAYTSSDDGMCTRVNLYNSWVSKAPDDARNVSGDLSNVSSVIIDKTKLENVYNITIIFELIVNE